MPYIVRTYWIVRAVKVFQEIAPSLDRTRNRHRWTGRVYQGAWENHAEGTRQITLVTSGEEGPPFGQPDGGGTDQGIATVYLKHRALRSGNAPYRV